MVDDFVSIHAHHTDEVVTHALGCLRMVEGGVAVAFLNCSVFTSLLLESCLGCNCLFQAILGMLLNLKLFTGQMSRFLKVIEKLN